MKKCLIALLAALLVLPVTDALAKRQHVRIVKLPPPAPTQPVARPVALPVVAMAFDLVRRTSCDPRIAVSTGPGDPGFDPAGPKTGNWLVPAIYRRECNGARPKWYGW